MALVNEMEVQGLWLFKHRGQIPIILFVAAIPVIYFTDIDGVNQLLITTAAVLLSILGMVIRAVAIATTPKGTSGRNTSEQVAESLNHTGIYSTVRHPLYVGNYFMWIGIVVYTFNIWFVLVVTLMYWLYYERIMYAEERFLERKFGNKYLDWASGVPAFIPSFKGYVKSAVNFSFKSILRREYSGFFATVVGFVFVDVLRLSFAEGAFLYSQKAIIALVVSALITLILRSLKHYTNLLKEEGRS